MKEGENMKPMELLEHDMRELMQVVRTGKVDDDERTKIATLSFMFGIKANAHKAAGTIPREEKTA